MHARFVARLWQDLREGHLGADYVAARIADLDRTQGDIDTLQGRIAAIRSWAYICQRPDWVLARDEMAARAHDAEARLSDALHLLAALERRAHREAPLVLGVGRQRARPAQFVGRALDPGHRDVRLTGLGGLTGRRCAGAHAEILLVAGAGVHPDAPGRRRESPAGRRPRGRP